MKTEDLRKKSATELNDELLSLLKAQFGLRMQLGTQQTTKTHQVRALRRDIARVRTLLGEKARQQS